MDRLISDVSSFKMGPPEDFSNFINAVIDERAFDKITGYIERIKASMDAEIVYGGGYSKDQGYFIEPTIVVTTKPDFLSMEEEIFGPVLTILKYEDEEVDQALEWVDQTSPYALTGAIFAQDRLVIEYLTNKLKHTAGNFLY